MKNLIVCLALFLPIVAHSEERIESAFGIPLGPPLGKTIDAQLEEPCSIRGNPETYRCKYITNTPNAVFDESISVLNSNRNDQRILQIKATGRKKHVTEDACRDTIKTLQGTLTKKYGNNKREYKENDGGFGIALTDSVNGNDIVVSCERSEGNKNLTGVFLKRFDLAIYYSLRRENWNLGGTNESGL